MLRSLYGQGYVVALMVTILLLLPFFSSAATTTTSSPALATSTSTITSVITHLPLVDTAKTLLSPIAQTRITNLTTNVNNRLEATLRKLTNIHDRIKTLLEKNATALTDTAAASVALGEANVHLNTASASLSTINREITTFIGSSNPLAAFIRLKATYTTIYTELIAGHSALRLSLSNLNGIMKTPTSTATTTTE